VLGLLCGLAWLAWHHDDQHGAIFALIGAAWFTPTGLLFLFAAHALRRAWPFQWLVLPLPLLYAFGFWILLASAM
jgi:hypothetical protein